MRDQLDTNGSITVVRGRALGMFPTRGVTLDRPDEALRLTRAGAVAQGSRSGRPVAGRTVTGQGMVPLSSFGTSSRVTDAVISPVARSTAWICSVAGSLT